VIHISQSVYTNSMKQSPCQADSLSAD